MSKPAKPSVKHTVPAASVSGAEIRPAAAQTLEGLQAELLRQTAIISALTAKVESDGKVESKPITDEALNLAICELENSAKLDLESGNPKASPALSLVKILGYRPAMTKEQSANWKPRRDAMRKSYSAAHRVLIPARKAVLARVLRNPSALGASVLRVRKDKTVARVSLSASEPAKKRKGKGMKKAKPAQVAASVPASPLAQEPAKVV
jgi:hypothetical protein